MPQARDNSITIFYLFCHLSIGQIKDTGLCDRYVRVHQDLGGESVSRTDNNANLMVFNQQVLH